VDLNRLFENLKQNSSNKIVYYEDGIKKEKIFSDVYADVTKAASFLTQQSVSRGNRVGILGKNSYQWVVIDLACICSGFVTVPLEPNHLVELDELIQEYELSIVLTNLKSSFWTSSSIKQFNEVFADANTDHKEISPAVYSSDDVFTFNFTSGTSGKPKAIEIKKKSFDHLIIESQKLFSFRYDDRFLVFLPLNVYLERCYIYSAVLIGFDVILVSPEYVFKSIQTDEPTVAIGVPYFFENVQKLFLAKIKTKKLYSAMLNVYVFFSYIGMSFVFGRSFFPFKKLWGGKMRYLLCGSAPIKRSVLEFYEKMGMKIYEGYGMNEIGGMITLNHPGAVKLGSVGKAFPGKNISFDEQGQIIVESDFHANHRYFKSSDHTNRCTYLDERRIATGDVGHIDNDGFIYITGRIKDLIILSSGIKVHPAPEEERLEDFLNVNNCCIYGDDKPYLTALIVSKIESQDYDYIKSKLAAYNLGVPTERQIRDFFISNEVFSVDNGLLTPAFKRNRKYLYKKFALEFEKLY
jgi:long-chain acyl-CoA synthetase